MANDSDSIFAKAGFTLPKETTAAPVVAPAADASRSIFEDAGFKIGSAQGNATEDDMRPTVEQALTLQKLEKEGKFKNPEAKSELQRFREDFAPSNVLPKAAHYVVHDTIENAVASANAAKQGYAEIRQGNYLPSFPSISPSTWSAGGVLHAAGGALGAITSPISGTVNALVSRPVTELTGNPDIGDRAGFVANALLPSKVGGRAARAVSPATKSVNALVDAIGAENVPEVVASMRANPRMTLADLSDPVRVTTQGLMAGGSPEVQDFISKAVRARNATKLEATNTAFTNAMGPAPNVPVMVEGLKQRAREAGRSAIQPALERAGPVDITPVITAIDQELKPGLLGIQSGLPLSPRQEELWRLRNRLVDPETGETMISAQRLHEIQSQTGDKAFQLQKSADGWTRDVGNGLRDVNEKLVDAIDDASGGAYRPARAKFKDAKDISEAFESGFDTLKNRAGLEGALEDSPAAFKKWMDQATDEEVVARRLGTRADIDRRINGVKNGALAGQTVTAIPYNREKLVMLFGEPEAKRLIRVMEDAQREAQTSSSIIAGSKTAETRAAVDRIKTREVGGGNPLSYVAPVAAELLGQSAGVPFLGLAGSMAAKGTVMGGQKIGQMMDLARNYQFARNALATGAEREQTINALLSHPKVQKELKSRLNALSTDGEASRLLAPP